MRRKAAGHLRAVSENQGHKIGCRSAVGRVGQQSTLSGPSASVQLHTRYVQRSAGSGGALSGPHSRAAAHCGALRRHQHLLRHATDEATANRPCDRTPTPGALPPGWRATGRGATAIRGGGVRRCATSSGRSPSRTPRIWLCQAAGVAPLRGRAKRVGGGSVLVRPETAGSADCSLQTGRPDLDFQRQQSGVDFAYRSTRPRPEPDIHGRQLVACPETNSHWAELRAILNRVCRKPWGPIRE